MSELQNIYNQIRAKHGSDVRDFYLVESFQKNSLIKVGLSTEGHPAILISCKENQIKSMESINLSGIEAIFNLSCSINEEEEVKDGLFNVIIFKQEKIGLRNFFFDFFEDLFISFDNLTSKELSIKILNLANLFSFASQKSDKTIRGLWAELFVILESSETSIWLEKWPEKTKTTFDFTHNHIGIDVKSFGGSYRKHYFKYEQLNNISIEQSLILSLCCKKDENGKSILDLLKAIKLEVDDNDLISMLETKVFKLAGENIADTQRFNLNIAKDTLMILEGSSIPKIQEGSFPSTVTEVSFKSDCSDVPMLPFSEENQAQLLKGVLVFPEQ
jgi:hypothetical protein